LGIISGGLVLKWSEKVAQVGFISSIPLSSGMGPGLRRLRDILSSIMEDSLIQGCKTSPLKYSLYLFHAVITAWLIEMASPLVMLPSRHSERMTL
jgi:hypothetical protein